MPQMQEKRPGQRRRSLPNLFEWKYNRLFRITNRFSKDAPRAGLVSARTQYL